MPAPCAARSSRWPPRPLPTRLLIAALAVLTAGCGGAAKFDDATGSDSPVPATRPPTTLPPTAAGPSSSQVPVTAAPARASSATGGTSATPSRATAARAPAPTVDPGNAAILGAASGPPGAAAGVILQPAPARTLVVEVLEEAGAPANRVALSRVLSDLRKYSGKSVSEVHTALPGGSPSHQWTERELAALADRSSKVPQGGGRFVLHMMSVRGQNTRSGNILAESFRGDLIATYPDRYASYGQHIVTTVTVHEVGHLLGLVDLYLHRGRADTENDPAGQGHSRNQGSVMYWAVDPSLLGTLFGSASDRFDAQDERDLAAIRAGATAGSNPA